MTINPRIDAVFRLSCWAFNITLEQLLNSSERRPDIVATRAFIIKILHMREHSNIEIQEWMNLQNRSSVHYSLKKPSNLAELWEEINQAAQQAKGGE